MAKVISQRPKEMTSEKTGMNESLPEENLGLSGFGTQSIQADESQSKLEKDYKNS